VAVLVYHYSDNYLLFFFSFVGGFKFKIMKDLKTIMLKSPKIKAIEITDENILKIVYTLRNMGLIKEYYKTIDNFLYAGEDYLCKLEVGDYISIHPDKIMGIMSKDSFLNDYLHY